MSHNPRTTVGSPEGLESVMPDLTELCRIHDVSLDLIERSNNLDELLEHLTRELQLEAVEVWSCTATEELEQQGAAEFRQSGIRFFLVPDGIAQRIQ